MKKIILILLIALIAIGGALTVFLRSLEGISKLDTDDVEFGGILRRSWTFDEPISFEHSDAYYSDGIKMAPKNLTFEIEDDFRFYFDYSAGANEVKDAFVIFGFGDKYYLDDSSFFMIDFDLSLVNDYENIYYVDITPDFRNDNYSLKSSSQSAVRYSNGEVGFRNDNIKVPADSPVHITYIFTNTGYALLYVNGEFVDYVNGIYKDDTTYFDGVKMAIYYPLISPSTEAYASVDNIQIHTFDVGYGGAINDLFLDPNVNLSENTDTIFGR